MLQSVGSSHSHIKKLHVFRILAGSARRTRYMAFAIVRDALTPMYGILKSFTTSRQMSRPQFMLVYEHKYILLCTVMEWKQISISLSPVPIIFP